MAATIAQAEGQDRSRVKRVHRLGSELASVRAATWKTFVDACVWKDGHGYVEIKRGKDTVRFHFNAETEALQVERG